MRLMTETLSRIAFCDPASGKTKGAIKKVRARSAIVVVGSDYLRRVFVLDAWADRCATDTLIGRIFDLYDRWKPTVFGIESNAQQSLFVDNVNHEAQVRGVRMPLLGVDPPVKVTKEFRIRACLQSVISEGRLFIPESCHELRAELSAFPMSHTVDLVDALASAVTLLPSRPTQQRRAEEVENRLEYLRNTGASPRYIADVAAGRA